MHRGRGLLGMAMSVSLWACSAASNGATSDGGDEGFVEGACDLRNDSGGPGQYADNCVRREWVAPYVGTYTSGNCELTIATPAQGPAAVFTLVLTDATLGGTYTHDWEGGSGRGNDSYYRFTSDSTFATTVTLNYSAGQVVSDTEDRAIGFRVEGLDTGTPTFRGRFSRTQSSPFDNAEVDCGVMTKS